MKVESNNIVSDAAKGSELFSVKKLGRDLYELIKNVILKDSAPNIQKTIDERVVVTEPSSRGLAVFPVVILVDPPETKNPEDKLDVYSQLSEKLPIQTESELAMEEICRILETESKPQWLKEKSNKRQENPFIAPPLEISSALEIEPIQLPTERKTDPGIVHPEDRSILRNNSC